LTSTKASPADAVRGSWVARAPASIRPYLQLSRFDRPVGFWLLWLPCVLGLLLSRLDQGARLAWPDAALAGLFAIGAVAMRGAGCTYNDILDRDIDARVARTAQRPLASGALSLRSAWAWVGVQCLIGFGVLIALSAWSMWAVWVALGSIPLVAAYPLMKRITWWPQVWLGLTFNWGVLVAAAATGGVTASSLTLYAALVFWTLGYDTIYALQDREDDALVGVRSTARRFGRHVRLAVGVIYALTATLLALAAAFASTLAAVATTLFALHLAFQVQRLDPRRGRLALHLFRSNRDAGVLLAVAWALVAVQ
jgi:4-hydroxybenzoate polyprenyltransferase